MTENNKKATKKIAEILNAEMKRRNISTYKLRKLGLHVNDVQTVLRRGNHKDANYTIETLLDVVSGIGIDVGEVLRTIG